MGQKGVFAELRAFEYPPVVGIVPRQVVFDIRKFAAASKLVFLEQPHTEHFILPVIVAQCVRIGWVVDPDGGTDCFLCKIERGEEIFGVHQVVPFTQPLEAGTLREGKLATFPFFGIDEYDPVSPLKTIECRGGGILQNGDILDVVGVQVGDAEAGQVYDGHRHAVDYIQWLCR